MTTDQALLLNPSWATVPDGQEKVWIKAKELPGLYLGNYILDSLGNLRYI